MNNKLCVAYLAEYIRLEITQELAITMNMISLYTVFHILKALFEVNKPIICT